MANIKKRANIWMRKTGNRARLAFEPLFQICIQGKVFGQNFDGNRAIQTRIFGAINFAHSTRSDLSKDFIWPKAHSGRKHQDIIAPVRSFPPIPKITKYNKKKIEAFS